MLGGLSNSSKISNFFISQYVCDILRYILTSSPVDLSTCQHVDMSTSKPSFSPHNISNLYKQLTCRPVNLLACLPVHHQIILTASLIYLNSEPFFVDLSTCQPSAYRPVNLLTCLPLQYLIQADQKFRHANISSCWLFFALHHIR